MRFLYLGQTSMSNRGCEALIRSNTALIRERFPEAVFLCPSENPALDAAQWPDASAQGVAFVSVPEFSFRLKVWNRLTKSFPALEGTPPAYPRGGALGRLLASVDAVLMTGGDIVSMDYGLFSLYHWTGIVEAAVAAGKPAHLLAASVGPFLQPRVEKRMRGHLAVYDSITIRETASLAYLETLAQPGATLVTDPAFTMVAQPWDDSAFFVPGRDTLGFNVSPLVRTTRKDDASRLAFDTDIVRFLGEVSERLDIDVVLVSHVDPLDDSTANSDYDYMAGLMKRLPAGARVKMLPKQLNTTQIKAAIGKCRYFMGARTHATVAALSQSIPTTSIAYSVKALGINQDLLSDTRYVLPTPDVSHDTLWTHLELLRADESAIRALLDIRIPEWKQKARKGITLLGCG